MSALYLSYAEQLEVSTSQKYCLLQGSSMQAQGHCLKYCMVPILAISYNGKMIQS